MESKLRRHRHHLIRNTLVVQTIAFFGLPLLSLASCRNAASSRSDVASDESLEELSLAELQQAADEWSLLSASDLQKLSQQLEQLPLAAYSATEIGKSVKVDGEKLVLVSEVIQVNETQMRQLKRTHPNTSSYWKNLGFNPVKVSPAKIRTSIDALINYLRSKAQLEQHRPPVKAVDSAPANNLGLLGYVSTTVDGLSALNGLKNNAEEATKRSNWQALAEARPTLEFAANVLAKLPSASSQRIATKLRILNRVAPIITNSFEANDMMQKTVNDWSN